MTSFHTTFEEKTTVIAKPDMDWYSSVSKNNRVPPRCPFAAVDLCPRNYQSVSLLGKVGTNTSLQSKVDRRLLRKWAKSPLWPKVREQETSISGPSGRPQIYSHFCPEIIFDNFGYFADYLSHFADEIDQEAAASRLKARGSAPEDWRWHFASIHPMHFTECDLYSLLQTSQKRNKDTVEVRIGINRGGSMLNRTVQPVHFEDFDGHQFERLVFAYLLRTDNWQTLEWYGQTGGDLGRDIWGSRERDGYPEGQKVCVQCTNTKSLTLKKTREDLEKVLSRPNGKPDVFIIVASGTVSAALRDKTKSLCKKKEVAAVEMWSGREFEERLRANAESLLKRFVSGEDFPDSSDDLRKFAGAVPPQSDDEILALMAGLFDRPAFYTPFHQESSIPAFKKAITDTIEGLNTGIHRLRDGTEIRRIPSRHMVQSAETKKQLAQVERKLGELRSMYDECIRTGDIRPCGCDDAECSVFLISDHAAREMDRLRIDVLRTFRSLYKAFDVKLGWRE